MNYELAKRLKDAGFPLRPLPTSQEDVFPWTDFQFFLPTLPELIEACGGMFHCLRRVPDPRGVKLSGLYQADGFAALSSELCSTPEEAVAKLWLTLNPKGRSQINQ